MSECIPNLKRTASFNLNLLLTFLYYSGYFSSLLLNRFAIISRKCSREGKHNFCLFIFTYWYDLSWLKDDCLETLNEVQHTILFNINLKNLV